MIKPSRKHKRSGLVVGKFMPFHIGHEYLLRFASSMVDRVTVVVDCLDGETIPAGTRAAWIREVLPELNVVSLNSPMPQDPEVNPSEFWRIWRSTLVAVAGDSECLIASADYGRKLAHELGMGLISCDIGRLAVPISATMIRGDMIGKWDYMSRPAQRYYQKRVVIMGPESTGKSVMCGILAAKFSQSEPKITPTVIPEYAEEHLKNGGVVNPEALRLFLVAQDAQLLAANNRPSPLVLMDTDYLSTQAWAEYLFNIELPTPEGITQPDLTILLTPETPWVGDGHRLEEASSISERWKFFEICRKHLEAENRKFHVVGGVSHIERASKTEELIRELLR